MLLMFAHSTTFDCYILRGSEPRPSGAPDHRVTVASALPTELSPHLEDCLLKTIAMISITIIITQRGSEVAINDQRARIYGAGESQREIGND